MNYLDFANSSTMLIICAIPILFITFQSILFYRKASKRGEELGFSKKELQRITRNSAIFTIVPALPILIFLILLAPSLGSFFPWLRLSVIGSGVYENIVANSTLKSLGFESFAQLDMQGFVVIILTMTISITAGLLGTIFILKSYSKKVSKMESKQDGFSKQIVPAIFIGIVVALGAPYFIPKQPNENFAGLNIDIIPMLSFIAGFGMFQFLMVFSKKKSNRTLQEFAFPLSILFGMLIAVIFTQLGMGVIVL